MNAKEFIQKFGWNDARVCILNCACPEDRWFMRHGDLVSDQDFDDLKRLVESYELVEKNQGLNGARNVLKLLEASLDIGLYHGIDGIDATTEVPKLRQAIADVESCMEVSSESN